MPQLLAFQHDQMTSRYENIVLWWKCPLNCGGKVPREWQLLRNRQLWNHHCT